MEFLKFFKDIGFVGIAVMSILLFMSLISWYYIFYNIFHYRSFKDKLERWGERVERLNEFAPFVKQVRSSSEDILSLGFNRYLHRFAEIYNFYREIVKEKGQIPEAEKELEEATQIEIERTMFELSRGLGYLATTASTAPFIGLFGTVWGIMRAFHEIGLKGSATLATVAPGIAEALINTALGLFVAIPASIFYNYFLLRREKLAKELEFTFRRIKIISKREFIKG